MEYFHYDSQITGSVSTLVYQVSICYFSLSADDRLRIERISKGSFDYKEALPIVSKFYSAGTCDKGK